MIGRTLAHYEIVEQLGAGGMGVVYRARDTKLGRDVAIKVLPAEFAKDPGRRGRFQREAKAVAALNHPNIVHLYSVEEADGVSFLTMELVEGRTLAAAIPRGGLPLDRFLEYAIPLADAIGGAHDAGITHRDLKPTNVMLDREDRVKVLDFGLAKLLALDTGAHDASTVLQGSDTGIGTVVGTPSYMSPEQAEGRVVDHRSDIFSLGILLYEMASGDRPFKGDTQLSTLSAILKDSPPHISEIRREMPRHVGRIVNHCLEKKPDARYQSAKDVRNELVGVRKEIASGELDAGRRAVRSGVRSWLRPAAAVLVLAAVGFFVLRDRTREPSPAGVEPPAAATSGTRDELPMTVVLPFENLGPAEDAYFAAGMTEEIMARLSSVAGIGVISATSARQYDRTGKTMKQIGEDLGVDYVLEGSVRWGKNADGSGQVRISPRLIEVASDRQLWSQTYDQTLENVFEVQSAIATQLIEQLGVRLTGGEQQLVESRPTENMEAYKVFLQAEELVRTEGIIHAILSGKYVELLTRATELDPTFLNAWTKLSTTHMIAYNNMEKTDARLALAGQALRRAEALDPDHPETHLARGTYLYYGFGDYEQALQEFIATTERSPSHQRARLQVGNIHRRLGHWDKAVANQVAALRLDPQTWDVANQVAVTYGGMRDFENLRRYGEITRDKGSNNLMGYMRIAEAHWCGAGDIETTVATLREAAARVDPWSRGTALWFSGMVTRDYRGALEAMRDAELRGPATEELRAYRIALAEAAMNGKEAAQAALLEANRLFERRIDEEPDNLTARRYRAIVLALLGRGDAAVREARLAMDQMHEDQFFGPGAKEDLAQIYTILGRQDEAIDLLEELLDTVYERAITPHSLDLEWRWDNLRDNPRFQMLVARKSR